MAKARKDLYSNKAYGDVTQTAANTLTFGAIQLAVGVFQGIAVVIHRILYQPSAATLRQLTTAADSLEMALTASNRLTAIWEVNEPSIIDYGAVVGIGAGVEPYHSPLIHDFSAQPGGGKIVAANPLYVGLMSQGFAAAGVLRVQVEFTFIELSDADYIELIQSQISASI